jgi:hypothetical protein
MIFYVIKKTGKGYITDQNHSYFNGDDHFLYSMNIIEGKRFHSRDILEIHIKNNILHYDNNYVVEKFNLIEYEKRKNNDLEIFIKYTLIEKFNINKIIKKIKILSKLIEL